MAAKELKLTRNQIAAFVGEDLRAIRVIENLIENTIIQDQGLTEDPDGNTIAPIRVTRWANGRMEMYPENPGSSYGGTVVFPIPFYDDVDPNITAAENFTVTALSSTGFTWTSTVTTEHMWRVLGRWKA